MLKLNTAWRDGTTHLVISPLEFMQRLAALVPRPRLGHGEGKRKGASENPILAGHLLRARKKRHMIIRRPKRHYFFDDCHGETSREQFRTA